MNGIELRGVSKRYNTVTVSYRDQVIRGNRILLMGPNGSGKSTLLKAIMGLIQYEGTITIHGHLAFMPERPQFPKDITMRTFLRALAPSIPTALIDRFELTAKLDSKMSSLSKGMMGKLNIVQCLMEDADWYCLDEPASGLDHASLDGLIRWLNQTSKRWIVSTHQTSVVERLNGTVIEVD